MDSTVRSLFVVALGGNAVSPPRGGLTFAVERGLIERAIAELAPLAEDGARLLIVHGNGPQVGRLLAVESVGDDAALDICVAQTQGELGYLIAEALDARLGADATATIVTRVLIDAEDPAFAHPAKPIGPVLDHCPADAPAMQMPDGSGWRRVVASPRPLAVIELHALRSLLTTHHLVAGGGGGVALSGGCGKRRPCAAVVDKDWVASLLAIELGADQLLYITDVPQVFDRFGQHDQEPIHTMSVAQARARLAGHVFAPGSMEPKVASAVHFVATTGRPAVIATLGAIAAALLGARGTTIYP